MYMYIFGCSGMPTNESPKAKPVGRIFQLLQKSPKVMIGMLIVTFLAFDNVSKPTPVQTGVGVDVNVHVHMREQRHAPKKGIRKHKRLGGFKTY